MCNKVQKELQELNIEAFLWNLIARELYMKGFSLENEVKFDKIFQI